MLSNTEGKMSEEVIADKLQQKANLFQDGQA